MNEMLNKLIVLLFACILSVFPGIILKNKLKGLNPILRLNLIIGTSLSLWMIFGWFAKFITISIFPTYIWLAFTFILIYLFKYKAQSFPNFKETPIAKFKYSYLLLFVAISLVFSPYFIMSIPPGCDISMHSYITRLIINNNGIPTTYDPIIPQAKFGSYSCGYQLITGLISFLNITYLQEAINIMSVGTYVFLLISIIAFYSIFTSLNFAIIGAIITLLTGSSIITTIGWGGVPTILSLSFAVLSYTMLIYSTQALNKFTMLLSSLFVSSIMLIHAIPAVIFGYTLIPLAVFILLKNKTNTKWILLHSIITAIFSIILLIPFLYSFTFESSVELTQKIKEWQNNMMGNQLADNWKENLSIVFSQIKYRIGDPLFILYIIALSFLLAKSNTRRYAIFILICNFYLYILVYNTCIWALPLSEILYPERITYFIAIIIGLSVSIFLQELTNEYQNKFVKAFSSILIITFLGIGVIRVWDGYISTVLTKSIVINKQVMDSFNWIEKSTPKNAVFNCTYSDAGMWIPTYSNRATIGAHIHFIHGILDINKKLQESAAEKYYFITKQDIKNNREILNLVSDKTIIFQNEEIKIYK